MRCSRSRLERAHSSQVSASEQTGELPEVYEVDVIRHYTALSRRNFGIDNGFYPLGSCTMKYNPKINEDVARFAGFAKIHPYQPEESLQGAMELLYNLQNDLEAITGMDQVTLQPAAGAHGEWTGLMMIRAYHESRGEHRTKVIVSRFRAWHESGQRDGCRLRNDHDQIQRARPRESRCASRSCWSRYRGVNANESEHTRLVRGTNRRNRRRSCMPQADLLYYDGANANAIMGITRPGDMGFDVVHLNLHKTMSTPHGGGGPGAGPVGVKERLIPFLPTPLVAETRRRQLLFRLQLSAIHRPRQRLLRQLRHPCPRLHLYSYTRSGRACAKYPSMRCLNANYMMARLTPYFDVPHPRFCKHEFVLSGNRQKKLGVRTLDIAKRLLDFGYHPPTIYFPLSVEECIMIEPTETESKQTLDEFIDTMIAISKEVEENPELVKNAPYTTVVSRMDEALAARKPVLNCTCG